jgi:hypothetical protein
MPEVCVFLGDDVAPAGLNIAAEIINAETLEAMDTALTVGEATTFTLDSGTYFVRAIPPDASSVSSTVVVGDDALELKVGRRPIVVSADLLNASLGLAADTRGVDSYADEASGNWSEATASAEESSTDSGDAYGVESVAAAKDPELAFAIPDAVIGDGRNYAWVAPRAVSPGWMRMWTGDNPVDWTSSVVERNALQTIVRLEDRVSMQTCIQIGGPDLVWRIVEVPTARPVDVIVRAMPPGTDFDEGVEVSTVCGDSKIASLESYLSVGQIERAGSVVAPVLEDVKAMFENKLEEPGGAVIAGYYLLAVRQQEVLGDWAENFAAWFDWLADAHVIRATQLLREPGLPHRDEARERLLHAATLRPPAYTSGLRLLYDGLRALAGASGDEKLADAVAHVREYADACSWQTRNTAYWADESRVPTLSRFTGDMSDGHPLGDTR